MKDWGNNLIMAIIIFVLWLMTKNPEAVEGLMSSAVGGIK